MRAHPRSVQNIRFFRLADSATGAKYAITRSLSVYVVKPPATTQVELDRVALNELVWVGGVILMCRIRLCRSREIESDARLRESLYNPSNFISYVCRRAILRDSHAVRDPKN
ncbi:hypothetical protein Plhal710r2_c007g0030731 [Plasmopara halstedii]